MGKNLWIGAWVCVAGMAGMAQAAEGDWLARARVIHINPDASSSALNLDVDSQTTLELDFSYFISEKLALELILATKKHEVTAGGSPIGTVTHLPPTLTLQYHFQPDAAFRPYVGAGVNFTRFYKVKLGNGALDLDNRSWGGALQAGVDIPLGKTLFLNLDIKKIWLDSDVIVKATGARAAHLDIDPLIFGLGVGMAF